MNEKVFLLFLGCVIGLSTSLPLLPEIQNLISGITGVDKDTLIKIIQENSQPGVHVAAKIEDSEIPLPGVHVAAKIEDLKIPQPGVHVAAKIEDSEIPLPGVHVAAKIEGSEIPQGIFSKIIHANKDSDVPMHGGDMVVKTGRSAINCNSCLWPKNANGTVPVPYILSTKYSPSDLNTIATAMEEFQSLTCVRFVPRTTENDYLNIAPLNGCYSFVGKTGGSQTVSLDVGCVYRGIVQHELDHALGFYHEQMRSDRDSYVNIMFQYISQDYWGNFAKLQTNNLGLEYDYGSVMHYDRYAFSNTTNEPSIVPKPDPTVPIGQRDGLSILDVSKINKLYQCNVCATLLNNQNGTFTSANYPSAYPNNGSCVWLIRTPSEQASLTFSAFDVESTPNCTSDYMKVYDGPTKNSPVLKDKTCGSQTIPQIIASTSQMLVEFVSDGAVAGVGFKATYGSVPCGGSYFNFKGSFTSPNYPNAYDPYMDCTYTITAPIGYKIALSISDLNLEYQQDCRYDYLYIPITGERRGPICGTHAVDNIYSTDNIMAVYFHSDQSTQLRGFKASYTFF